MPLGCYYYPTAFGKLGAIKSRGLSIEEIDELLKRDEIEEIISFLQQKSIPFWDEINLDNLLDAEHLLRAGIIEEIDKIWRVMNGKPRDIFNLIIARIDLFTLKFIFRNILSQKISSQRIKSNIYIHKSSYLNSEKLLDLENVEEISSAIRNKDFRQIFKEALEEYKNKENVFYFELGLENSYSKKLWERFSGLSYLETRTFKGSFVDIEEGIREFLSTMRLLHLEKLENSEIFHYLNFNSSYFTAQDFWELSEVDSFDSVLNKLKDYKIGELVSGMDIDSLEGLEIGLKKESWKRLEKKTVGNYPFLFISFLRFWYKQNYLVHDLIRIIGGKKNNFSNEEIKANLVTVGG